MNYILKDLTKEKEKKNAFFRAARDFAPLMRPEKKNFFLAFFAILVNAVLTLLAPLLIAYTIDHFIAGGSFHKVIVYSGIVAGLYLVAFVANYLKARLMGEVGQRTLFHIRGRVFSKIGEMPVAFFHQNKAGDLISRINNDTEKLNNFFSHALVELTGNVVIMLGAGIFMLAINWKLGLLALIPAVFLVAFTRLLSPWVKRKNTAGMQSLGAMSAEVAESLDHFKVIAAFNRRDYFRAHFDEQNRKNFKIAFRAGVANNTFGPVYTLFSNLGQMIVLAFGIYLIINGSFTIGFLISYLVYVNNFYNPLRQIAGAYTTLQSALSGWDRITQILSLESNLPVLEGSEEKEPGAPARLEFQNVSFHYAGGEDVLHDISFTLERGKTYAIVGPTGGGKSTTASLASRLYDRTSGEIRFNGSDIRALSHKDRTDKIGFILQDPFIMSGTVRENILYGNAKYGELANGELANLLKEHGLEKLLTRFPGGLETKIAGNQNGLSIGQKQLIAFIRAVLREPELLILDEATANVDTVTEALLSDILEKIPRETTVIVIAHRLNTIKNADDIFFIGAGELTHAGSFGHALEMLSSGARTS